MNFNIQSMQNNISKINRKRKYDNFCGNFQIVSHDKQSSTQRITRENKRLRVEVSNLNHRITLLEIQLQNLCLEVKEMKEMKEVKNEEVHIDKIPCELEMFYYA